MRAAEPAAQVSLDHQHAFLLRFAAEIDDALDIQDAASSDRGAGRDAAGAAEGLVPQVADREGVYLADRGALGGDRHISAPKIFEKPLFGPAVATPLCRPGGFEDIRRDAIEGLRQALRLALPSVYLPVIRGRYPIWLRCPACRERTWTRVRLRV